MYRIIKSKLRERFKDNPPKKRPYYSYCSDNECETFFPITTPYEILHLRVNVWPKIKKKWKLFVKIDTNTGLIGQVVCYIQVFLLLHVTD